MNLQSNVSGQNPDNKKFNKNARYAIMLCLIACVVMLLSQLIMAIFIPGVNNEVISLLISMGEYIVSFIIPFGLLKLIFSVYFKNIDTYIPKRSGPRYPWLYVFGTIGFCYFVNLVITILFTDFVQEYSVDSSFSANSPAEIILNYVFAALMPAFIEELTFRGIILKNLLPYGKCGAVFFSSLMFGIVHIDPPRIIFATIFGILLSVCYEHTGSLTFPIIIHFLNNALSVTISLIPTNAVTSIIITFYMIAMMSIGLFAIIYYLVHGIKYKKVSLLKPACLGYKLSFLKYTKAFFLNFGIIPLLLIYSYFFILYYF